MLFILIKSGDDHDDNDGKKKEKETEDRKPLVGLYDIPGMQWTYSIPGPTQGQK